VWISIAFYLGILIYIVILYPREIKNVFTPIIA
jgi:hypothetical protein